MTQRKKLIAAAIATLGLSAPVFAHGNEKAEGKHESVQLSSLPQAAQDTIKREAGSDVSSVYKETDTNGKTLYEAEFTKDGKKSEIKVGDDGMVVSRDTGMKHSEAKGRSKP